MNPARSLGPAIAAWEWRDFWLYVVGPVAGAALAALAYQGIRGESSDPSSNRPRDLGGPGARAPGE